MSENDVWGSFLTPC